MKCLTATKFKKMGGLWQSEYIIKMEKYLCLNLTSMDRYMDKPEGSRLNYINYLEREVYNKRGFFSSWVQLGKDTGYLNLDECIAEVNKHKTAMLELDKLNGKNLKNKELKENL